MRKALIVGIDNYPKSPLTGCVDDARRMYSLLNRNFDDSPNFECKSLISSELCITRSILAEHIQRLFASQSDVAVLYFAGHGTSNNLGGFLVTEDAKKYADGVSMTEILTHAIQSPAREVVILLDCCHSGEFGQLPSMQNQQAILREGLSILTACRSSENASESPTGGLFTGLVCDALSGGEADVCGKVTVAGIYTHVDRGLNAWDEQRPLFKSHVSKLIPLRNCAPIVDLAILRLIPRYFTTPDEEFKLDPSFEPDAEPHDPKNEEIFGHLQRLRAGYLVVPIGEEHMYYAAMNNKSCKLTAMGRHYWRLANQGKI